MGVAFVPEKLEPIPHAHAHYQTIHEEDVMTVSCTHSSQLGTGIGSSCDALRSKGRRQAANSHRTPRRRQQ